MTPTRTKGASALAASLTLALLAPAAALAHGRHAHGHHLRHHRGHLSLRHFGPAALSPVAPAPAGNPSAPAPAPASGGEDAGKVATFTGGILTITLNDNSSVSGKVTEDTRIVCTSAAAAGGQGQGQGEEDHARVADFGSQQSGGEGQDGPGQQAGGDDQNGQPQPGAGDDSDEEGTTPEPPCDSSVLTPGAVVRSAELRIGPGGNEFEYVEIVR